VARIPLLIARAAPPRPQAGKDPTHFGLACRPPISQFPRTHPTPVTPVMLLIAIFSVTVLLLCWLCYSGESKR
jgi:hypothetical protein